MPFTVKPVSPEWADVRVCLIVFPAVRVLKRVGAWLIPLCFQMRRIYFFICFIAPYKLAVVL